MYCKNYHLSNLQETKKILRTLIFAHQTYWRTTIALKIVHSEYTLVTEELPLTIMDLCSFSQTSRRLSNSVCEN